MWGSIMRDKKKEKIHKEEEIFLPHIAQLLVRGEHILERVAGVLAQQYGVFLRRLEKEIMSIKMKENNVNNKIQRYV